MADIDNLTIQIQADATSAEAALDGLISKLREFDTALNLSNAGSFKRQLKGIRDVVSDVNAVSESFSSLQGFTMPDFSGLTTLADGISRLSKIKPEKIADIVNALNGIKSVSIGGKNGVKEMADEIDRALSELSQQGNKANFIVDELGRVATLNLDMPFKQVVEELRAAGNAADFVVDSTGNIARVAQEASDAVQGVAQGFELALRAATPLSNIVAQPIEQLAAGFQLATVQATALGEHIEHLSGDVVGEPISKLRDAAEEYAEDITIFVDSTAEWQDGVDMFSQYLHKVLSEIEKYNGLMAQMRKFEIPFDARGYMDAAKKVHDFREEWQAFERAVTHHVKYADIDMKSLDETSRKLTELIEKKKEFDRTIASMESGEIVVDSSSLSAAYKGSAEAAKQIERLEASLGKVSGKERETSDSSIDLLANLVALGHEIGNIANAFDRIGDFGIKALKVAFKPMDMVIKEYKEKIESIGDAFKHMQQSAKRHLDKLSAFWKRSMKTFTFMLVRKAITAVLTEVGDAVKSLALWSKQFGTVFNDSMSHITSNLSYMARAIVGAFEPLINFIVPAFNALADAVANVAARVGEFFAAMTGQGYYMKAKKQLTDYGESVEKARKAQKNLIAGLDDLNVITTPTSTDTGMDDVAEQWEKMDVSDKMKDFAQSVKDLAKRLFDPIKKAWDEAGDHVIKGWKYMTSEIGKLLKDIGRDFLKVWEQPETQKIFENLFHTIGYIEEGIGHLARNFREAWNDNEVGLHILEGIRNIILDITEHVKNMAKEFRDWADELTFKPLLNSLNVFLQKIRPFMDFLGSLAEEWWQRVILRHWKFLIEEAIPHLLTTIGEIAEAFHWDKILEDLKPVMDAFETMRENIETGIVNAIGNLGKRIAEFANSEDFTKFTENVAWFMNQITAERVEKLFTALGTAILQVAEALMRFVGSDKFKDFIQKLLDWYDSKSVEDLAEIIRKIATAIALFKFAAFVGKGFSNFISLLTVLQSFGKVAGLIVQPLAAIGKLIGGKLIAGITGALGAGGVALSAALILAITAAVAVVINNWDKIEPVLAKIADAIFYGIGYAIGGLAKWLGEQIAEALRNIWTYFEEAANEVGGNIILGILWGIVKGLMNINVWLFDHIVKPFIDGICAAFGINSPATTMIPIGGYLIEGLLEGVLAGIAGIAEWLWTNVAEPIISFFAGAAEWLFESGVAIIDGLKNGIDSVRKKLSDVWEDIKKEASDAWEQCSKDAQQWWNDISKSVQDIAEGLRDGLQKKWDEVKQNAIDAWTKFNTDAREWWGRIKETISDKAEETRKYLYQKWEEVKRQGHEAWVAFNQTAHNMWQTIRNTITTWAENARTTLESTWNNVKATAETVWGKISESAHTIWENIKSTIVGFAEGASRDASQWFWQLNDWASDAFWSIVNGAGNILGNIGSTISGAFSGVKSSVQSAFNDAGTWLTGVGKDIVSGLSGGITSAANTTTFYKNTATPSQVAINANRKKIDGHSPSRVFMDIGKDIVDGLDIGITKNAKSTEKAVDTWLDSVLDIDIPVFDVRSVLPNSNMKLDAYAHTQFSGTVDSTAIQQGVREGVQEAIGSLILPYLNDIAQSSRETAAKEIKIGDKAIGQAASRYAKDYQIRTGRPAYGY